MNRALFPFGAIRNNLGSAPPRLSVLIPVYRHDATPLLMALKPSAKRLGLNVEVIVYDDGSRDPRLTQALAAAVCALDCPTVLLTVEENGGRAAARNALIASSRARHVLFLDADMIPDAENFLDRWHSLAIEADPAAAFGGFSVKQAPRRPETALHHYLSSRSDCLPVSRRAQDAAQFTTTSNLLVRRDVLQETPFDGGYEGWGWEDVDWALRVSRRHKILHIDIPATHAGLDTSDTLLRKFSESGRNYRRLAQTHPDAVRRFRSYRAAQLMRRLPGQARARALFAALARARIAPLPLRHAALKLFRTSVYAENLP